VGGQRILLRASSAAATAVSEEASSPRRAGLWAASACVVVSLGASGALGGSKPQVLNHLETGISRLLAKVPSSHSEWDDLARQIEELTGSLENAIGDAPLSAGSLETLDLDATLITRAASAPGGPESTTVLRTVLADLKAKTDSYRASPGFAGPQGGEFAVTVVTVRDGAAVNGLLVQANMAGDPEASPPWRVSTQLSSPAGLTLPPGGYFILIRTADSERPLVKQYALISGSFNRPVQLTVSIPAQGP